MSVNNNAHRHTLSFTLLLIPLRHKWHHSVWWQRTTVPAMKASQSGRRSKKQVYAGAFCLLFACITWPRFCVMFTLKDKTWGSFMKSDLCPTFFFFLKINMKVRKRTDSALPLERKIFFFPGPISSCHAKPPARGTFPTGVRYQIKENWP